MHCIALDPVNCFVVCAHCCRVDSRTSFSVWLCEQHNIVNKKIGKPSFPCTMEKLDERWRKGKPACWGEDADEEATPSSLGRDL